MPPFSLQQLRIFRAVAHAPSLSRAAKSLGLAQPSLSQAIQKLEKDFDVRLFDRTEHRLRLTAEGRHLLRRAEAILDQSEDLAREMTGFREGGRSTVAIGALASLARCLVPDAFRLARQRIAELDLDLHELDPAEAVQGLHDRTLQIALISKESVPPGRLDVAETEILTDPYVLATPAWCDLSAEPDDATRAILGQCIRFEFGNAQTHRVEQWYRNMLPRHEVAATCRAYDSALALVEAGIGVALVPSLATRIGRNVTFRGRLWQVPGFERTIVALAGPPSTESSRIFLACLQESARTLEGRATEVPRGFLAEREA